MMRNKGKIILLSVMIIITLILSSPAYAQEEEEPEPDISIGITPDSPFYIFDTFIKKIGMFFTFGNEAKARKALEYAAERLAEANLMAAQSKLGESKKAKRKYNEFAAIAAEETKKRLEQQNGSENILEMITRVTSKHLLPMYNPGHFAPQKAGEAATEAREVFTKGTEHAARDPAGKKPPKGTETKIGIIEKELDGFPVKIGESSTEQATRAVSEMTKLFGLGEETGRAALETGAEGVSIDNIVANSSSVHLSVLVDVYEKVPEESKPIILRAMQASIRSHEEAVESLDKRGIVFNIPEKLNPSKMIRGESGEGFIHAQPRIYGRESRGDEAEGFFGIRTDEGLSKPRQTPEKYPSPVYAAEHESRRVKTEAAEAIREAELRLSNLRSEAREAIFAAETELQEAINRAENGSGESKSSDELFGTGYDAEDAVREAELKLQEIRANYAKAIEEAEIELHEVKVRAERAIYMAERKLQMVKENHRE